MGGAWWIAEGGEGGWGLLSLSLVLVYTPVLADVYKNRLAAASIVNRQVQAHQW
jgi:hypothetical protein